MRSIIDYSLFTYLFIHVFLVVLVYVDDLILIGSDPTTRTHFKQYLHCYFHTEDIGALSYVLGIDVVLDPMECIYDNASIHLISN